MSIGERALKPDVVVDMFDEGSSFKDGSEDIDNFG